MTGITPTRPATKSMRRHTQTTAAFRPEQLQDALTARTALAKAGEGRVPVMAALRSGYKQHVPLLLMKYIATFISRIPRALLIRGMVIGLLLILLGLFDRLS